MHRSTTHRRLIRTAALLAAALLAAACSTGDEASTTTPATGGPGATGAREATTVRLVTHDSFDVSPEVLDELTEATGITVEVVQGGDAVTVVNQAILTAGNPQADVLFGIDDNLLSAAAEAELFEPLTAEIPDAVPDDLRRDPALGVVPVDVGDVCVNYDRAYFDESELDPPTSLDDLVDPAYAGLLVVQDPASSTPGLAFVSATVAAYGEDGWLEWWEQARDNDVLVAAGWEQAYYGEFSGGSGEGTRPLVVSYATSPPAEVVFSEEYVATGELPDQAPTGVVTDTCVRQVEMAGVLRGAADIDAATTVVEFLLSASFQADVPLHMFVLPARDDVELPEVFTRFSALPGERLAVPYDVVGSERDEWVDAWTDVVVR